MRLELASTKAIKYAVMNWHYSKAVPIVTLAHAVFNDAGEWCGVICYGPGANPNLHVPYGLKPGQAVELVRVALNGKQALTSQALSRSLKLVAKHCPLIELIISYADTGQGHKGTIYQATNWTYTGAMKGHAKTIDPKTGKVAHPRTIHTLYGTQKGLKTIPGSEKLKYIYPISAKCRKLAKTLAQPYPKAKEAQTDERPGSTEEVAGSIPSPSLT